MKYCTILFQLFGSATEYRRMMVRRADIVGAPTTLPSNNPSQKQKIETWQISIWSRQKIVLRKQQRRTNIIQLTTPQSTSNKQTLPIHPARYMVVRQTANISDFHKKWPMWTVISLATHSDQHQRPKLFQSAATNENLPTSSTKTYPILSAPRPKWLAQRPFWS